MDDFHTVRAEDCNPEEAAKFYIKPRSHPEHINEFYIVYYDSENKKHGDPFVPHYLQRSVTIFDSGTNQPLMFGHYSQEKDTPLALYKAESALSSSMLSIPHMRTLRRNRRRENMTSVSLSSWISEPEGCIIQHARQSFTSPYIVAVVTPSPSTGQQPEAQPDTQNETQTAQQNSEDSQVQQENQESEEVQQEMQESQEVQETQASQGSLPGEQEVISEPAGQLVYQVMWMDLSDGRVGAVKSFEIVSTKNN